MAKGTIEAATPGPANTKSKPKKYDDWEVRDAMRTLMRAGEITKDKKLLELVRACAAKEAVELKETAARASMLAKMGRISPKQLAKLGAR